MFIAGPGTGTGEGESRKRRGGGYWGEHLQISQALMFCAMLYLSLLQRLIKINYLLSGPEMDLSPS